MATLKPGDCFGEMSLLTGEPRAASIVASSMPLLRLRYSRPWSVFHSTSSSSVARSLTAETTSVFITLWISGMCLSPMPWMLCSPKPFSSMVGHSSASTATIFVP